MGPPPPKGVMVSDVIQTPFGNLPSISEKVQGDGVFGSKGGCDGVFEGVGQRMCLAGGGGGCHYGKAVRDG